MPPIRLTVLGCGSSSGTPVAGCDCAVCTDPRPQNSRSRCSAWLDIGGQGWLIDTTPDFRTQALREQLPRIDGVLYTHPHADHLNGIDDLRAFCYKQQSAIPIYGSGFTLDNIRERFGYVFLPPTAQWNRPILHAGSLADLPDINGAPLTHFQVPHGRWQSTAYRIGNIAWLTDLNHLAPGQITALQGLDYLFIDCLGDRPYPSHLSFGQACAYAAQIGARQTYLIHMTHSLDYFDLLDRCPPGIAPAYDGLTVCSPAPASGIPEAV
ncbi:MBL fold metallo-hydrolase [Neisseria leonii]|uniref:MBL fold metallo-hydrolase n=1 Tax=Neisseria leonii TaxID=2995413 RepID=UPI00237AF881|nr:MBL fold metallo-hydrolase [Neisseria sp. 3986]MDD9326351.1 MBL fold metallo-hydrolase [Neisseria sp. 3986]